jgi:hypothetical protein
MDRTSPTLAKAAQRRRSELEVDELKGLTGPEKDHHCQEIRARGGAYQHRRAHQAIKAFLSLGPVLEGTYSTRRW